MIKKETANPVIPELLAPVGSFEKLVTAVHYGADAVYLSGKHYSLRAQAANFELAEMARAVNYAHERTVKVYVAVNIFAHEGDFVGLDKYLLSLAEIGVDGFIVSDPGILVLARKLVPGMPVHLSTQANVTNAASAQFWQEQGVSRLNLARELGINEIGAIHDALVRSDRSAEIEIFVHGAICISYSGRCLLSHYLTGRSANQGQCAHPCRYNYVLLEEKRPGQYFPVEEDERGAYIFNSRDLCLLNRLPELLAAGVNSLKIEGRMKSLFYVGSVVRVYRAALDYLAGELSTGRTLGSDFIMPPEFMEELLKVGTRGYTENFINGPPGPDAMLYDSPRLDQNYAPAGIIRRVGPDGTLEIEVRNTLKKGEMIEYLGTGGPGLESAFFELNEILKADGNFVEQANPGDLITFKSPFSTQAWVENGLLRKGVELHPR